jgi:hypothetical protein
VRLAAALRVVAPALVAAALAPAPAGAQEFDFQRDCAKWIEQHGYSADYIKQKVGKRQPGPLEDWRGNVAAKDVQPGDVVLTRIRPKARGMRAAYVEEVRRNADGSAGAVIVSEWNEGKFTDERCNVTDHFGILSPQRPITIDSVAKVWRPSLPL